MRWLTLGVVRGRAAPYIGYTYRTSSKKFFGHSDFSDSDTAHTQSLAFAECRDASCAALFAWRTVEFALLHTGPVATPTSIYYMCRAAANTRRVEVSVPNARCDWAKKCRHCRSEHDPSAPECTAPTPLGRSVLFSLYDTSPRFTRWVQKQSTSVRGFYIALPRSRVMPHPAALQRAEDSTPPRYREYVPSHVDDKSGIIIEASERARGEMGEEKQRLTSDTWREREREREREKKRHARKKEVLNL